MFFAGYLSSQAEELDFATSAVLVQAWNSMLVSSCVVEQRRHSMTLALNPQVDPWFSLVAPHEALNPASERHVGPLFEKGLPGFIRHWLPSLAPLSNSFIIRVRSGSFSVFVSLSSVHYCFLCVLLPPPLSQPAFISAMASTAKHAIFSPKRVPQSHSYPGAGTKGSTVCGYAVLPSWF